MLYLKYRVTISATMLHLHQVYCHRSYMHLKLWLYFEIKSSVLSFKYIVCFQRVLWLLYINCSLIMVRHKHTPDGQQIYILQIDTLIGLHSYVFCLIDCRFKFNYTIDSWTTLIIMELMDTSRTLIILKLDLQANITPSIYASEADLSKVGKRGRCSIYLQIVFKN